MVPGPATRSVSADQGLGTRDGRRTEDGPGTKYQVQRTNMRRVLVCFSISLIAAAVPLSGQSGAPNGEWRTYGGDLGNTRYAPLDQINRDNFNKLEVAWRFKTDKLGPRPEFNYESTPLMVGGVIYVTAGSR